MSGAKLEGVDELRCAVRVLDNMREDFNQKFTTEGLLRLLRAFWASDWDITPDAWADWQITAALDRGVVPQFDANERPVRVPAERKLHAQSQGAALCKTSTGLLAKAGDKVTCKRCLRLLWGASQPCEVAQ